jgi:hypothetical protein
MIRGFLNNSTEWLFQRQRQHQVLLTLEVHNSRGPRKRRFEELSMFGHMLRSECLFHMLSDGLYCLTMVTGF